MKPKRTRRVTLCILLIGAITVGYAVRNNVQSAEIWEPLEASDLREIEGPAIILMCGNWLDTSSCLTIQKRLTSPQFIAFIRSEGLDAYIVDVTSEAAHSVSAAWLGPDPPLERPLLVVLSPNARISYVRFAQHGSNLSSIALSQLKEVLGNGR